MPTASLDDFMALNDQVAALVEAGVPLDVDLGPRHDTAATLERINALVARRVSQGATLTAAIESDDKLLTPSYRSMVQLGLCSEDLAAGLKASNQLATSTLQARQATRLALIYPLIVCCFAFVGFIGFCLYFVPVLQSTYGNMRIAAGSGLRTLESLRTALPYWALGVPLTALALAGWRIKSRSRFRPLLPGSSLVVLRERAANFAENVATLLDSGLSLPESLRLATDTWDDASRKESTRLLAAALDQGQVSESSHLIASFPPFLRWALISSEPTIERVRALRIAARVYFRSAARRHRRLQVIVPMVIGLALGGTAVLLYGLALFVPVIQMLRGLATGAP
jgi:type II secretory pathway component PulF